jgi:hypothetical protein
MVLRVTNDALGTSDQGHVYPYRKVEAKQDYELQVQVGGAKDSGGVGHLFVVELSDVHGMELERVDGYFDAVRQKTGCRNLAAWQGDILRDHAGDYSCSSGSTSSPP